ncbi:periplasmic trehalase [Pseudomonas sp. Cab53]|uniref:Putative periplasmic trehalase n=2 Tax=Pseudomonas TaxID=286 RepID=A0A0G3G8G6_9PSED|nr:MULTISPECIES: alpha,alpha-trehalase TreA [Pseudomonas]AKJ96699.1 trehalase [Pseudomonas chlororaphis]ROM85146.1 alpha,alpha-trehalase [Pseudomonas brassicacearum]BBP64609.1 periplasmic trehalase [Pseudomonas sp. Cab53]
MRPMDFTSLSFAALLCAACSSQPPATWSYEDAKERTPLAPDHAYPELFEAVQRQGIFTDQKHFVDALPKRDPAKIRADYLALHERDGFDLKGFVQDNFIESGEAQSPPPKPGAPIEAHIDSLWPVLSRTYREVPQYSSLLPLPQPYVVPGGRFREMYYWDSYFTMLGLEHSGDKDQVRQMTDNFAYMIDTYGHIPNGNRTYYLSRSQPPFFAYMVELQARIEGDQAYARYLPQLQREYAYWMDGAQTLKPGAAARHVVKLADGSVLNRYWDASATPRQESWLQDIKTAAQAPDRTRQEVWRDLRAGAESGWDFSSRWLGDGKRLETIRTTAIVPVDLNSLMYHLERTIAKGCETLRDVSCVQAYGQRADRRQQAIERHLWKADGGYYVDYDWQLDRQRPDLTAAALFPLYTGLASNEHARRTAEAVRGGLLRAGGLATTQVSNGQQWDEPNGWAPLQWVAVEGLDRYQQGDLAAQIGQRFLQQVQNLYRKEDKLVEKYNVSGQGQGGGGGEYALQDGFGWTNGVTLKLLEKYGANASKARTGE